MRDEGGVGTDWRVIREDFDRIAQWSDDGWNHNRQYHRFLLEQLPPRCEAALDIGCGTGTFTRLLAERAERVLALDLSPEMISVARERSPDHKNIDFRMANMLTWECEPEQFDCVASIATLHHLPLQEMLTRIKSLLRPNGTLLVLDLFQNRGLADRLAGAAALPLSAALKVVHNRRLRPTARAREAWAEHGRHDRYLTVDEVRSICGATLPGAAVTRHFFFRYSIVWRRG